MEKGNYRRQLVSAPSWHASYLPILHIGQDCDKNSDIVSVVDLLVVRIPFPKAVLTRGKNLCFIF